MHIKGKYSWVKHFDFMVLDILALVAAFYLNYFRKFGSFRVFASENWRLVIVVSIMLEIIIGIMTNPYSNIFRRRFMVDIRKSVSMTFSNFVLACIIMYVFKIGADISRDLLIGAYLTFFVISCVLKYGWKKLLQTGIMRRNLMNIKPLFIVTTKAEAEETVRNALASDFKLYDLKGIAVLDDNGEGKQCTISGAPIVKGDYLQYILENNIGDVLFAVAPRSIDKHIYRELINNDIAVHLKVSCITGIDVEDQFVSRIGVSNTLAVGTYSFTSKQLFYLFCKRVCDICIGLFGTILLLPIMAVVKIATMASGDTGSIFYTQKRVGQNGKPIRIYKFRSMVQNSEEILQELLKDEKYRKEWDENQKFEDDPRITAMGRILRKTSIDETPQFLNILKGDMSLIGPRPLVEGELEAHDGLKLYHRVKPGLTGWWACNGRNNIEYDERLKLEYYYVKNCSFTLDFMCVIRTVMIILKREGAK